MHFLLQIIVDPSECDLFHTLSNYLKIQNVDIFQYANYHAIKKKKLS